jgi:hypothetical protein
MLFKILLSAFFLTFFSGKAENCHNKASKKITVIGIAENDKDAAIVVTDTYDYIIDGLDEWSNKYNHKKVKVTGILVSEEHKKQSTDSVHVQERVGTWRIIKKAKWILVK